MFLYDDHDSPENDLLIRKLAVVIKDEGGLVGPPWVSCPFWGTGPCAESGEVISIKVDIPGADIAASCKVSFFLEVRMHCLLDSGHCCCHTSLNQLADVVSLIGLRRAVWLLVGLPGATAFRCGSHPLTLAKYPTKLTSFGVERVVQSTIPEYYYTGS